MTRPPRSSTKTPKTWHPKIMRQLDFLRMSWHTRTVAGPITVVSSGKYKQGIDSMPWFCHLGLR